MSAVQDETDVGPEELNSNEDENHAEKPAGEVEDEEVKGYPAPNARDQDEDEEDSESLDVNGTDIQRHASQARDRRRETLSSTITLYPDGETPSSADGSLSRPDDTPSIQGSFASSPRRGIRLASHSQSPTPSLRPFDRRFQARLSSSPVKSPRPSSPAFLHVHSRQSPSSHTLQGLGDTEPTQAPWDVVRWTKLRKMTGQAFSEVGKRNFGRPTCIAVSASIALGTSKGIILVFDYNQNLKSIIGLGTKAIESGSVTSLSISADHSTIAGGHASGGIFTWEIARPAKPFLQIPPIDRSRTSHVDGHTLNVAVLHLGFLGTRHTALASADDRGMAFSHLATRGMGMVARSVKTTRILGRYPEMLASPIRTRKASSVLAFSPLPLGNAEHAVDTMGLVAMLTPYLLVIVSTTPVAQTQYKSPRPKEVAAHGAMTGALAWFPSVKLKVKNTTSSEISSRAKLVYCWSNVLTILEIVETGASESSDKTEPPTLQFRQRSRWRSQEAIVGIQWLSRSVLALLTITQQLIILEDTSLVVTDSSDLIQKHIYHADLFSPQLNQLVDQLEDEEIASMHGVVADAFYMSFRAYKSRLFLLGYNEISFGTLSNWADRLLALMEEGSYIGAIQLATGYYSGRADKVTVGLPEDDVSRQNLVREKLTEMMLASIRYAFGRNKNATSRRVDQQQLRELASACITACISMHDMDFLFDDIYSWYQDESSESDFLERLEPFINDDGINTIPPTVIKDLVGHYTAQGLDTRLEELICHLDPRTMDIDQITTLCKKNRLYDALLYVWNQALGDYTTLLNDLLGLARRQQDPQLEDDPHSNQALIVSASKIFPYLSYILTGRIYPTGKEMPEDSAITAKAEIYDFFFSGSRNKVRYAGDRDSQLKMSEKTSFQNLRRILDLDAPSFLSMLNEAFEDSFLNGPQDRMTDEVPGKLTEEQKFGLSVNRQWVISILLEVMTSPSYEADDTIYLDIFIARNLPKFPQFILLPGHVIHRVLVGLCEYPTEDIADDCQLSVEYLLSMYQPPDLSSLIPLISKAHFYRVLKAVHKAEKQYAKLLQICFEDHNNPDAAFDCIGDCLRSGAGLNEKQISDVRAVIVDHGYDLLVADVTKAASTIDQYAPDLHGALLNMLEDDESAQFRYLQVVLESPTPRPLNEKAVAPSRYFVEQYVRLLCNYNPSHVSKYVEQLETGGLRLQEVLPALEDNGIIDAAVVLLAREGKVREGLNRLTQHLNTLESALLGLLDGARESPDVERTMEACQDLISSIQKYARVGIWLCQGQTKAAQQRRPSVLRSRSTKHMNDALSTDEELWLDLIDTVVAITKSIMEVLERQERKAEINNDGQPRQVLSSSWLDLARMIPDLRLIVQETFTALLATTSGPGANDTYSTDASFLRILRGFLNRASLSSPSLSSLRAVLGAIFSAYSYEQSLLSLANQLLDKDLFVRVTEADTLRRRGWRPLGQVCEGCGRRVWGAGAGGSIWDAWQRANEERDSGHQNSGGSSSGKDSGKGKAVTRADGKIAITETTTQNGVGFGRDGIGPVVIFSCRHLFHRSCLEKTQDGIDEGRSGRPGPGLICPLCT